MKINYSLIPLSLLFLFTTFCSRLQTINEQKEDTPIITKSDIMLDTVWNDDCQMYLFPYEDIYAWDEQVNKLAITHQAIIVRAKNEKEQREIELNSLSTKFHEYDSVIGETIINNYLDYYYYWYTHNN